LKILKIILLLVIALGLLWFSEAFPFWNYFEPQSPAWTFWVSFAKDLIQPFAFYFFLCLGEKWLKTWRSRALVAFAVPTLLEFGQIFYRILVYRDQLVYMGNFDPLDILMYAIGVALAVLVERKLLAKLSFWEK
jgi:hypothetical protein